MNKLRLLDIDQDIKFKLSPILFTGEVEYLPNTLQWLSWRGYPSKYLPKSFQPINLVHLDLSGSMSIVETPDVSGMPNLKVLYLADCDKLLQVHPSIGVHKKLVNLNLRHCENLEKFPRIIEMESLEILDLYGCTALTRIPSLIDLLSKCEHLHWLSLEYCYQLVKNPTSFDRRKKRKTSAVNNMVQQSIPQFLQAFWDWRSVSNILCTRHEALAVYLPHTAIPNWLYGRIAPIVKVNLPPSWFNNDKLRGIALWVGSGCSGFSLHTCNGLVFRSLPSLIGFLYIPISKITSEREWKDHKDSHLLFDVTSEASSYHRFQWGIRLVYEGGDVFDDITTYLSFAINYCNPSGYKDARLKVCVAPSSESGGGACKSNTHIYICRFIRHHQGMLR